MSFSRWPSPPVPGAFGLPFGCTAGAFVVLLAVAGGATHHPSWSLLALMATVATAAVTTTVAATLGTAAVCWACHAGFVLGRRGELVFTTNSFLAAVALVSTAVVISAVAGEWRALHRRTVQRRLALALIPSQSRSEAAVGSAPTPRPRADHRVRARTGRS
ncbi:MAG TPA: hypothetical protein VGP03_14045 [Pseudonocardiaceae bacterium]|nr:hypothetical protein [Pseudonocardiaceae bacterium]